MSQVISGSIWNVQIIRITIAKVLKAEINKQHNDHIMQFTWVKNANFEIEKNVCNSSLYVEVAAFFFDFIFNVMNKKGSLSCFRKEFQMKFVENYAVIFK